jgi:membrane-bound lytic murein transglycosylase MltF
MRRRLSISLGLLCCSVAASVWAAGAASPETATTRTDVVELANQPAFGDLAEIRQRRFLRVLVVPNKTHYFIDQGHQYGLALELGREFEKLLNRDFPLRQKHYVSVVFIPVHRDQVFPYLQQGRGDIAIANLTRTPEREAWADFSRPFIDDAREIIAARAGARPLQSLDDLSGRPVYVRPSSSFHTHLQAHNQTLLHRGLPPITLLPAEEYFEAEDLLEMLNAGIVEYTAIDQHIGEFWQQVFPNITLQPQATLASGQQIAWALRKKTPQLRALVNRFMAQHRSGTLVGNTLLKRYLENTKWARSTATRVELARFERTIALFRKYGNSYDFDPLMLAAQGYQESGLDQSARSPAGAIGIMQLMPTTGAALKVGDIRRLESNIHGGAKYMRLLVDTHFNEPGLDAFNRTLFAFAAYNAGPTRVAELRRKARRQGLDPTQWFHHVEIIATQEIGRETTQYVANIAKYYVGYKLLAEQQRDPLNTEHGKPRAP